MNKYRIIRKTFHSGIEKYYIEKKTPIGWITRWRGSFSYINLFVDYTDEFDYALDAINELNKMIKLNRESHKKNNTIVSTTVLREVSVT